MPEEAKIFCFNCGCEGNHYYLPIIFKGEGFYSCDPLGEK